MKLTLLLLFAMVSLSNQTAQSKQMLPCPGGKDASLDQFRWENRVLVLFAPDLDNESYKSQIERFSTLEEELADRDIVTISIFGNDCSLVNREKITGESAAEIADRLEGTTEIFSIYLIGKDGGVKLERKQVLQPEELFQVIDRMPMRQREMRDGG